MKIFIIILLLSSTSFAMCDDEDFSCRSRENALAVSKCNQIVNSFKNQINCSDLTLHYKHAIFFSSNPPCDQVGRISNEREINETAYDQYKIQQCRFMRFTAGEVEQIKELEKERVITLIFALVFWLSVAGFFIWKYNKED